MSARRFLRTAAVFAAALFLPGGAFAAEAQTVKPAASAKKPETALIEQGRYLVRIAGCNDCHTAGYAAAGGKIPEKEWLTGDRLGWRGPWGTTYPTNLRLFMQGLSEEQWVKFAHSVQTKPPMPWFALHAMTARDLRAMHRFIKQLGPAGAPAPGYVPPDQEPKPPYVLFPQPPK